jgi:hypothetical protein
LIEEKASGEKSKHAKLDKELESIKQDIKDEEKKLGKSDSLRSDTPAVCCCCWNSLCQKRAYGVDFIDLKLCPVRFSMELTFYDHASISS